MSEQELSFPKSWYPLCRSSDLGRGQVIRRKAFGMLLVIFRTPTGRVSALNAICSHLGGDLSRGSVVGERLRCPLHSWEFDVEGICRYIPYGISIPQGARQLWLNCQERYGLVFACWGREPSFALPSFGYGDSALWSRAFIRSFNVPYQILAANAFASIYTREFIEPPTLTSEAPHHFSMRFKAQITGKHPNDRLKQAEITIHCWGGNTILIHKDGAPNDILATLLPVDQDHTDVFITTVAPKPDNPLHLLRHRIMLTAARQMTLAFLRRNIQALSRKHAVNGEAGSKFDQPNASDVQGFYAMQFSRDRENNRV